MHSKVMRHRYICQPSPTYPRNVFIDTSINIKDNKQYINNPHAPKLDRLQEKQFKCNQY